MVTFCNTICDRFFKQIAMLNDSRRQYNHIYNKRVVKSISSTTGINKKDYLQCSRCVYYLKKSLAIVSLLDSNYLLCPCCGTILRSRKKGWSKNTQLVKRID